MEKHKLDRINELTRISRERPLTEAETLERSALRTEYIREYRAAMTGILDNSVIVRPDGTRESVRERKKTIWQEHFNLPLPKATEGVEETEQLGKTLAKALTDDPSLPRFVALYGELGAGKTAFVRGFAAQISPGARVKSPTFTLVNEYPASPTPLFHFDMYRIKSEDELYSTGFYDYHKRRGFMLTEWSENIPFALPERYIEVKINKDTSSPDRRAVLIKLIEKKDSTT